VIHERFRENGFLYVSVDINGYRTGSMNEGLASIPRGVVD
jgi:PP-loop superfamily ATP-utilizing enzyme